MNDWIKNVGVIEIQGTLLVSGKPILLIKYHLKSQRSFLASKEMTGIQSSSYSDVSLCIANALYIHSINFVQIDAVYHTNIDVHDQRNSCLCLGVGQYHGCRNTVVHTISYNSCGIQEDKEFKGEVIISTSFWISIIMIFYIF